jgi:hypothetical protein
VRSYRCEQVLMFHHFPRSWVSTTPVRATEFAYHEKPNGSFISQVLQSGLNGSPHLPHYLKRSLPPLSSGIRPARSMT